MNKIFKNTVIAFLCVLFFLFPLSVHAKVTVLDSTPLKNVTKAKRVEGEWEQKGKKFRFRLTDGTYKKDGWFKVKDKIYYVNAKGNRVKGWVKYRDHLYFLNQRGALKFGWLEKKGRRYYLRENGCAARGRYTIGEDTYFFDYFTYAARSGWVASLGKVYFFSPKTYRMKKNAWVKDGEKYYYVDENGCRCGKGWRKIKEKLYYLDSDGSRMTGVQFIDGKGYYFTKKGVYDPTVKVDLEVDPNKPMVALTFDDGPGQYTNRLLDCLQRNGAKATFFMVGSNVPYYQATVKRMSDMGCELGAHSYDHTSYTSLSSSGISADVNRTVTNIRNAAGRGPTVFRLPYGNGHSTSWVLSALGLPSIYWSIDPRDWANTGNPSHTVNEVLNNVRNGDIVLMHDIHYSTIVAAEQIIPALKQRGYQLVTVSQLAKYKGKTTLYPGKTYYHFR